METEELSKQLETLKKTWVGKSIHVKDINHPHFNTIGEVIDVEYTLAGWGMKIKNMQNDSIFYGDDFYIFNGKQIDLINHEKR